MSDRYTHGHHQSVLRSHLRRSAQNSAAYLLEHLREGDDIIDIGCGPGNITVDLARLVAPGRALGIDASADVIDRARADAPTELANLAFETGDTYSLGFPDDSFDVVHAHQVLQHLTDPVRALREMRRVLRPGGLLAVRDADYKAFMWSPSDPLLDRWLEIYQRVTDANDAEADAGRQLLGWVAAAGFLEPRYTTSNWTWCTDEDRAWWGGLWAQRVLESDFAHQASDLGFTDRSEQEQIAEAFLRWAESPVGIWVVPNGEVLARA